MLHLQLPVNGSGGRQHTSKAVKVTCHSLSAPETILQSNTCARLRSQVSWSPKDTSSNLQASQGDTSIVLHTPIEIATSVVGGRRKRREIMQKY